ncbi:MAG: AMP-binding protein [Fibrobacterota bacterium]
MADSIVRYLMNRKDDTGYFAFFSRESPLSYKKLCADAVRLSAFFSRAGMKQGDRVIVLGKNSVDFITALVACWMNRALVLPESSGIDESRLANITDRFSADCIINTCRKDFCTVLDRDSYAYDDFDEAVDPASFIVPESSDPALCIYTSGSTGHPKGVVLRHDALCFGAANVISNFMLSEQDRGFCVLPMTHINGIVTTFFAPVLSGGSIYYYQDFFDSSQVLHEVCAAECTWISAIPVHYRMLADYDIPVGVQETLSSRIRFCRSASAKLPEKIFHQFIRRYRIPIIETMGMTETCGQIFANPIPPGEYRAGSVGMPINHEARIIAPDGRGAGPGVVGSLLVRSNSLMSEYLDDPGATEKAFQDGWLITGDLAEKDRDGYFYIRGRQKNIAIFSGENISLSELDQSLNNMDSVHEACCISRENPHFGEVIEIYVIVQNEACHGEVVHSDILHKLKGLLPSINAVSGIYTVQDFPRTSVGKIDRVRLKNASVRHALPTFDDEYPPAHNLVGSALNIPLAELDDTSKMGDFPQWDSLGHVIVLTAAEQYLGRQLATDEIHSIKCLSGLQSVMSSKGVSVNRPPVSPDMEEKRRCSRLISQMIDFSDGRANILHLILSHDFLKQQGVQHTEFFIRKLIDEVLSHELTVVMNAFNWDFCKGHAYYRMSSPAKTGLINEQFRRHREVQRTFHPIYSYVGAGSRFHELYEDSLLSCWGPGSTTWKLLHRSDVSVIGGGVPFPFRNPIMHALEEIFAVSYRYSKTFEGWYIDGDAEMEWLKTQMFVRDLNLDFVSSWDPLGAELKSRNRAGFSDNGLFRYSPADVLEYGSLLLEENRNIFYQAGSHR